MARALKRHVFDKMGVAAFAALGVLDLVQRAGRHLHPHTHLALGCGIGHDDDAHAIGQQGAMERRVQPYIAGLESPARRGWRGHGGGCGGVCRWGRYGWGHPSQRHPSQSRASPSHLSQSRASQQRQPAAQRRKCQPAQRPHQHKSVPLGRGLACRLTFRAACGGWTGRAPRWGHRG